MPPATAKTATHGPGHVHPCDALPAPGNKHTKTQAGPVNPTDPEQLSIVCVTYNSAHVVPALARSLRDHKTVVIVDNASSDDTVALLQQQLPQAQVIARKRNAGFGAANNQAMARVSTPYALLLNPDCQIQPGDLQRLLQCLQAHPQAGLVAPQGWRSAGVPQKSWRPAFHHAQPDSPYRVPDTTLQADWVHGSCLLVRRTAFEQIGGFDPTFFLYYEDDDLCLRMQQAGWHCLLEPSANSLHPGGASSSPSARTTFIKQFHYARSRQIALGRYAGHRAALSHRLKLLLAWLPAMLLYALLLRRHDLSKWFGWGLAASCASLHLDRLAARIR